MDNIENIRRKIGGHINQIICKKMYNLTYELKNKIGDFTSIDIGPGSGISTICISKAYSDSYNNGKIYTIDKFFGTSAFRTESSPLRTNNSEIIEKNKNILKNNIKKYSSIDNVQIIEGTSYNLKKYINQDTKIGIVFIDTDGMINKDFKIFYDNVIENGIFIFDDYANKPNNICKKLVKMNDTELEKYIEERKYPKGKWEKDETIKSYCMGKHIRIYKIVQYFVKLKLLEIIDQHADTIIVKKISNKKLNVEELEKAIKKMDEESYQEFLNLRSKK